MKEEISGEEMIIGEVIIVMTEVDTMSTKEVEIVLDVTEMKRDIVGLDRELRKENEKVNRKVQKNRQVLKSLEDLELLKDPKVLKSTKNQKNLENDPLPQNLVTQNLQNRNHQLQLNATLLVYKDMTNRTAKTKTNSTRRKPKLAVAALKRRKIQA